MCPVFGVLFILSLVVLDGQGQLPAGVERLPEDRTTPWHGHQACAMGIFGQGMFRGRIASKSPNLGRIQVLPCMDKAYEILPVGVFHPDTQWKARRWQPVSGVVAQVMVIG